MISKIYFPQVHYSSLIEIDKPLYKFIPVVYLYDEIINNYLYLSNIVNWEDKWEQPIIHIKPEGHKAKASLIYDSISHPSFGTCFTKNYDRDCMWKIFSQNRNSVCIEIDTRKLLDELKKNDDCDYYLAPVSYVGLCNNNIMNLFKTEVNYPGTFRSSFFKRKIYEYEEEVRLCAKRINEYKMENKRYYKTNIKLGNIINKIILDPRLNKAEEQFYTFSLKFLGKPIEKSHIYDSPVIDDKSTEDDFICFYKHSNVNKDIKY